MRLRIVPIRRPSVAPHLCHQGCEPALPVRSLFIDAERSGRAHTDMTVLGYSPYEEESMQTTTTTAGPRETQIQRTGDVMSPSIAKEKTAGPRNVRLTVNLPSHLVEQMRDAVYWTPGLTLAWMIARAVRASLADLETIHQGPFPRRLKPLRAGRPRRIGQSMDIRPLVGGESADGQGKILLKASVPMATKN